VAKVERDYKAQHARRIAGGAAKGRGHSKPGEAALSAKRPPKRIEDEQLQRASSVLGRETSLPAAAEAARG
jgi:hypothetical protein